ncbi:MAG: hypothetical protein II266_03615 [Clostridia bacterium]|nr:hypothetical protein [Clostridia bacterium]
MKRIAAFALILVMCVMLAACSGGSNSSSGTTYTNKYGTPTTKCAYPGCSNKIASSGDTNCCVTHSNKCLNCRKYIDGDAMYCMSCLTSAASKKSSNSVSGSSGKSAKNKCSYKQGGKEVCSSPRASGSNFCSYHTQYLNDAYDSLFGH